MSIVIIAEAGVNHNGDIALAKKLIDKAADAGADYVKFQTFRANELVTRTADKAAYQKFNSEIVETQYEMLNRLELSLDDHYQLSEYCVEKNINFFSTGFDIQSMKFLVNFGLDRVKIPSGEITNLPYLRYVGGLGKPIILSTGMSSMGDIEAAIDVLEKSGTLRSKITVLHCTTEYPTPMSEINLSAMQSIRKAFGVSVGYSDHSAGIEVSIAAAALGAKVIEKHFTLDRNLPGPDHKASLEPNELKLMISMIRNIEIAMGDGIKRLTESEVKNKCVARKSIVAIASIKVGEAFTPKNISVKRPANGISPMNWDTVIGRRATRDFSIDELIEL